MTKIKFMFDAKKTFFGPDCFSVSWVGSISEASVGLSLKLNDFSRCYLHNECTGIKI